MKALIFAAGLGTRLKPFTDMHPKALAHVAGVPMLKRVIDKFLALGIRDIIVNAHHFADQITTYLFDNYASSANIMISDESDFLLDTGGGLLAARNLIGNSHIIAHNADILTDFNMADMIESHFRSDADATLLAMRRETSRYLLCDMSLQLNGWINLKTSEVKPAGINADAFERLAFGGVHVINPSVFDMMDRYNSDLGNVERNCHGIAKFSIIDFYLSACRTHKIMGFMPEEKYEWHDIGKPDSLRRAEKALENIS